jgi:hypothetical protein
VMAAKVMTAEVMATTTVTAAVTATAMTAAVSGSRDRHDRRQSENGESN